jgi:hypothetical protein
MNTVDAGNRLENTARCGDLAKDRDLRKTMTDALRAPLLFAGILLSACSGNYSLDNAATGNNNGGVPGTPSSSVQEFFGKSTQSNLSFCRTCHVPGGVADTDAGKRFMLSSDSSRDYANLLTSWTALGKGIDSNKLLTNPSDPAQHHSGGQPWPVGSQPYNAMKVVLTCWDNPAACAAMLAGGVVPPVAQLPLLGSKRAQHVWASYCEGKTDDVALPVDPRSLIRPGINAGKAVYYNAWWQDCRAKLSAQEQRPKTCGDYRTRRDRGLHFLEDELPASPVAASAYNDTWKKWGLTERPANFDQMYTLRYGLNHAPFNNPYPLPGEDPNASNGGSGQLPLGLRQLKDASGKWTSGIGSAACFQCHGGQIGDPSPGEHELITLNNLGLGNNNFDVVMSGQDSGPFSGTPLSSLLPATSVDSLFNIGIKQRGQNNAVGAFEVLITLLDFDSLGLNPNPLKTVVGATGVQDTAHPLAHTQDTPAWWNFGSRPRKFFDAGISNDSTRIIMAAGPGDSQNLVTLDGKAYRDRIKAYDEDLATFFLSLKSPAYPAAIDTALAEQGAVLFHSKNLWAMDGNKDRAKPLGGNGSCASCHGVYSPRYVNDSNYLETPALEGVAGHISPLNVIGTDRARSDMLTPTLRERWDSTYWGYTDGMPGFVAPGVKDPITESLDDMLPAALRPTGVCGWEKEVIGYQAPPLYGVWATSPYFHNGSVPTLDEVLNSSKRKPIWRRKLQTVGPVTGFDQRVSSAYDFDAVGWKHDTLSCSDIPGNALSNCNPVDDQGPSLVQMVANFLNGMVAWSGAVVVPDPTPGAIDKRLVYDTRVLGNGNGGHEFTDVLTDQERKALIEYLKTL